MSLKISYRNLWRVIGVGTNEIVQPPLPVVEIHKALGQQWRWAEAFINGPTAWNVTYVGLTFEEDCFAEIWASLSLRTALSSARLFSLTMRETSNAQPYLRWHQIPTLQIGSAVHWHIDHVFLPAQSTITLDQADPLATGENVLAVIIARLFLKE